MRALLIKCYNNNTSLHTFNKTILIITYAVRQLLFRQQYQVYDQTTEHDERNRIARSSRVRLGSDTCQLDNQKKGKETSNRPGTVMFIKQ